MACTLAFFDERDWARMRGSAPPLRRGAAAGESQRFARVAIPLLGLWFALQCVVPLRHWLYPGDVLWTEEGFRFAWNVMLVEKTGHVTFTLRDAQSGEVWEVVPGSYLTPQQERQMSFQPDMIWDFAQFLEKEARRSGRAEVEVRAEAWVSLNGRASALLLDPTVDLTRMPATVGPKEWILWRRKSYEPLGAGTGRQDTQGTG